MYLWIIVILCALLLYHISTRTRFYKLASNIPGPRALPLLGNIPQVLPHLSRILDKICELLEEHGGIAAVWLGNDLTVFISDPEYLEIFFNSTKMLDRSHHYRFIEPALGQGLFTANGDQWKRHRKLYAATFNSLVLKKFIPVFQRQSRVLVDVMRKEVGRPAFDIFHYIKNCTLDFIFETTMSCELHSQTNYIAELEDVCTAMDLIYQRMFTVYQYPSVIFNSLAAGRKLNRIVGDFRQLAGRYISMRRQTFQRKNHPSGDSEPRLGEAKNMFMDHMLMDDEMTDEEIRDHVLTMAVTGFDATGGTLGFVFTMLGIHQQVQDKVYQEILTLEKEILDRELESQDLDKLEYMELVIKETLRLCPVGPLISRTLSEDVQFGQYIIPQGATVAASLIRTHRDPNIYPDPFKFNPDNFLPENTISRHPYAYAPFSAGPRGCIGMKYAMMSMKIILMHLVGRYRILCDRSLSDLKLKPEIVLKVEGGFLIRIEERCK